MTDDRQSPDDSRDDQLDEATQEGSLPYDADQPEQRSETREDVENREGVIPKEGTDLDPERELEDRPERVAEDETVGGIFQPGGRGG